MKKLIKKLTQIFLAAFCLYSNTNARIRLFTFHHNRPDFIEVQHRCLNKFLKEKDDFELIVFSDAIDPKHKQKIEQMCKELKITCINFPQELHHAGILIENMKPFGINESNGSVRHCQLVQYALDNFGYDHDDIVGVMEGDVFLIKKFSIREYLKNHDFIGTVQTDREKKGLEYIWIGLNFFKIKNLPNATTLNFDLTFVNGTLLDSGGSTHYYLKNHPTLRVKKFTRVQISSLPRNDAQKLKQLGFTNKEISFLKKTQNCQLSKHPFVSEEFHLDNHFLHYSWSRNSESANDKSKLFQDFFNDILN